MCWRDDVPMERRCEFCHRNYFGSLGHKNCPKFLNKEMADKVIHDVLEAVFKNFGVKRTDCHVRVLAPTIEDEWANDYPSWPNYSLKWEPLTDFSAGTPEKWEHKYDEHTGCKMVQGLTGRSDGRTIVPHLLFRGETVYAGYVEVDMIRVTCSGFDECDDRMTAGMIAHGIVAAATRAFNASRAPGGEDYGKEFLT